MSKKVIIRTCDAGVHYGDLLSSDSATATATLGNSRRCYRWQIDHKKHGTSQVTCSELAVYGPHGDSRIAVPVDCISLSGVIEIITCTAEAAAAIEGWPL